LRLNVTPRTDRQRFVPNAAGGGIHIDDLGRVRLLTWDRPHRLNAWNDQAYTDTVKAIVDAAVDPDVAVLVITGAGRAFTSGGDTSASKANTGDWDGMGQGGIGAKNVGEYGFIGLIDQVAAFPKPLVCAVNGLTVGGGVALLGLADLVLMSTQARVRAPFAMMGVTPEGGLTHTLAQLLGRNNAMWALLSGEWLSAQDCLRSGLAWRLCEPDDLLTETLARAQVLAGLPLAVLIETKRLLRAPDRHQVSDAREREFEQFRRLIGTEASREGLIAHQARTVPDYPGIDARHPVATTVVVSKRVSRQTESWSDFRKTSTT
jgi:enoyl-CoA hydratase/carnithine racemase